MLPQSFLSHFSSSILLPSHPNPLPPMGCGMSRYGIADHLGFQPIKKKLDDLRRNDRIIVTVDDTPSTKLLLRDGEDHVVPNADDSRKSISSPHVESAKGPSLEHKESSKIAKGGSTKKKNGVEEKEKKEVKSKNVEEVVATERGGSKDGKRGGDEGEEESDSDDDDEEGRVSDYDGSAMWIGSPSFREYCHNDAESEDSFKAGGKSDGEKKEIKMKKDSGNSSPNSDEVPVSKPSSKGRKGKRFRKVFPMGKPSAMKNFLHVSSCYNPHASAAAGDKLVKPIEKTV